MSAAYDKFDYPSYWIGREYEHEAELIAINAFLSKIKKTRNILEIGAGFGRLTPVYQIRGKNIYLSDPSSKLLSIAKKEFSNNNIKYIHSSVEKLRKKVRKNYFDLILIIRVLHHIKNLDDTIKIISDLLVENGYLILEFPNKVHLKATILEILKGNLTVILDIFPKDIRSQNSLKNKTLPFFNYHPENIIKLLKDNNFEVVDIRSVSNIRSRLVKRYLPLELILFLERHLQKILTKMYFGPSIFILAKKT